MNNIPIYVKFLVLLGLAKITTPINQGVFIHKKNKKLLGKNVIIVLVVFACTSIGVLLTVPNSIMPETDLFPENPNDMAKRLAKEYPTIEDMQKAINDGKLDHSKLPAFFKTRTTPP